MSSHAVHPADDPNSPAADFYRSVLKILLGADIRFLVGGAFALKHFLGVTRDTKDMDIFLLPGDVPRTLELLENEGWPTELKFPHWLGKIYHQDNVVDVIFSSGNGLCPVDERWFEHALESTVLGLPVQLVPIEELIWQKAFIRERHRYDGADVMNLLHHHADTLDWDRLLFRFGENWLVLLSDLILFRYVYPHSQSPAATQVMHRLLDLLSRELASGRSPELPVPTLCRGTFLSLLEYLPAVNDWGYRDARLPPTGAMSPADIDHWTTTFEK